MAAVWKQLIISKSLCIIKAGNLSMILTIKYCCINFSCFFVFIVTVIEVLPKEKKQKEEKTVPLGQCTVDMLPLVKGIHQYSVCLNPNLLLTLKQG